MSAMSCFHNLSKVLYDTFAATVQYEDELSYSSSTLILAGLLQIYARSPRYASFKARLDSYPIQVDPNDLKPVVPSSSELASAGFFHTGSCDETVCPACGLGLRDWQTTDQPEACHTAYSTAAKNALEMTKSEDQDYIPVPAFPCLFLAVHRLLVSELPLARKFLVPVGSIQSIHTLPGVIDRPAIHRTDCTTCHESVTEYSSFSDRLRAIVRIMNAPPAPMGWPVENARALGHSDDLIIIGLWRLQAEAAQMELACPLLDSIHLDPHSTVDLLRAILRVQEGFDDNLVKDSFEFDFDDDLELHDMTAEDVETAALSRCRPLRLAQPNADLASSPRSVESYDRHVKQRIRLPPFYQFLMWWSNRWPMELVK